MIWTIPTTTLSCILFYYAFKPWNKRMSLGGWSKRVIIIRIDRVRLLKKGRSLDELMVKSACDMWTTVSIFIHKKNPTAFLT